MKVLSLLLSLLFIGCATTTQDEASTVIASALSTSVTTAYSTGVNKVVKAVPIFTIGSILHFIVSLKDCNGLDADEMLTPYCVQMCDEDKMLWCPKFIAENYDQCDAESKTRRRWTTSVAWWCGEPVYYTRFKPETYRR